LPLETSVREKSLPYDYLLVVGTQGETRSFFRLPDFLIEKNRIKMMFFRKKA